MRAVDSGVLSLDRPYPEVVRYLAGDFEDTVAELGWRVLGHCLWENEALSHERTIAGYNVDWFPTPPCPYCKGTGRVVL